MQPQTKSRLKAVGVGFTALGMLAIAYVGGKEGLRTVAYRDVVGVPTVCFGETRGVKMGQSYSVDQCKTMLGDGLAEFESGMRACLTAPDKVPDKVYVAGLSLAYNIGLGAFCHSTVARLMNAGNWRLACDSFLVWNKAGGRIIQGLVNRRADERKLCLEGVSPA